MEPLDCQKLQRLNECVFTLSFAYIFRILAWVLTEIPIIITLYY